MFSFYGKVPKIAIGLRVDKLLGFDNVVLVRVDLGMFGAGGVVVDAAAYMEFAWSWGRLGIGGRLSSFIHVLKVPD